MAARSGSPGAWLEALALPVVAVAANVALEAAFPAIESPLIPFLAVAYVALRRPNYIAWVCLAATLALSAAEELAPWFHHAHVADAVADLAILFVAGALFIRLRMRLHHQEAASASRFRDEAARFRNLLERSPDGIWRIDADGRTLEVNAPMAAMIGYTRDEMLGRHFEAYFDEESRRLGRAAVDRGRNGEPMTFELSLRRKDGAEVRTICSTLPILDAAGRFVEGFGVLHDITERYRGEQERHQALSLLEATLESTADGLLVVNLDGRIVRFNERFATLWRIPGDILSSGDDDRAIGFVLSQLEDPDLFVAKVRKLYATPDVESFDTLRFKDGRVFERYSMPQRLDGEIIGRVWSFRDVTDRERAAEEQRLAMEREASIAANLDAALFTCALDAEGNVARYDYLSRGAEALYGLPRETIENDPGFWLKRVHSDDLANVVRPMLARLVRLQPAVVEVRYQSSKGIYRWHRSHLFPRREADGSIHVDGIEADVTERVKLEDQLRHAQKMEAIGQLAGGVAHDFNNILTAVIGYSDLLLVRMAAGDSNRHAVEEIRKGADRAAGLTRQLLAFGRRATTQPRLLDPNEAIRDLEPMLRRLVGEDVRFEIVLSPSLGKIRIDPTHFEQIIVNLAVNARDALPGGGTIRIETDSADRPESPLEGIPAGRMTRLVFSDNGVGIPPEVRDHIFEPFFTTKEAGRGTGLGLATVYGIVRQHHGAIEVSSEPGKGTSFEIHLPEAGGSDAPAAEANAAATGGRERILLVEDDAALLTLSREILLELGYEVFPARGGAEALGILERLGDRLDILVTDVVMPEIGGRELARRALDRFPDLTVLYVSGYPGNAGPGVEELERGAAFLPKPFTPLALARKVREILDARAATSKTAVTSRPAPRG